MKLSTKGKYAVYAMYYLAKGAGEGPKTLRDIATMGIPEKYLEQLLGNLRRVGLVKTTRGVRGGYELAKAPDEITVGDVIGATEGPVSISECLSEQTPCFRSSVCAVRQVWEQLTGSINIILDGITLQDMLCDNLVSVKGEEL